MNIQDWHNNIQLINTETPHITRKCLLKFNEHVVEVLNLTHLTIQLNNWHDEGLSENHSSIQFGYISTIEPKNKCLFYITIHKTGVGSYDMAKSKLIGVMDMADDLIEQFELKPSIKLDEHLIKLELNHPFDLTQRESIDNIDTQTLDFIQIATPVLKQLGLFDD